MGGYLATYTVTLEVCNGDCGGMFSMDDSPGFLSIYCVHIILWWEILKY